MANPIDSALGIFPNSLQVRSQRAEILANNLANADTPGFMARDVDFKSTLAGLMGQPGGDQKLNTTAPGHSIQLLVPDSINGLMYRMPSQPSVDGNTVDMQKERSEFTRNTLEYQASVNFLTSKIKGLMSAIKGGE